MKFANPEAFLLFIPLILGIIYNLRWGVKLRSRFFLPLGDGADSRPPLQLITPFKLYIYTRSLVLALGIFALARPQKHQEKHIKIVEAVDMIIAFDLSKSMDAIDLKPNRHAVGLKTISEFIDRRKDDRIGLVLFSGEAILAVPLTQDHDHVKEALRQSTNRYLEDGTAIGQAIAVGVSHLKNSKAKSRIIVLVTDGDNNMGSVDPMTASELAKGFGIKIYTIGLGQKGKVAFPVKSIDAFGREIETYQYITDAVDDKLLASIADLTGGQSYHAEENGVLEKIFETIDRLEKTKIEENTYTQISEKVWPWLLACCLLLLFEGFALNTKWRKIP